MCSADVKISYQACQCNHTQGAAVPPLPENRAGERRGRSRVCVIVYAGDGGLRLSTRCQINTLRNNNWRCLTTHLRSPDLFSLVCNLPANFQKYTGTHRHSPSCCCLIKTPCTLLISIYPLQLVSNDLSWHFNLPDLLALKTCSITAHWYPLIVRWNFMDLCGETEALLQQESEKTHRKETEYKQD